MPQEGELVLCTITKIQFHSVFAHLDEYDKGGMIHIAEISPGRIRNIHEFVSEGKKVVCKILRIDRQRGHIDLSYRRVTEALRRTKIEQIKKEQKAEKILENVARQVGKNLQDLYKQMTPAIFEHYEYLHEFFVDVAAGNAQLKNFGIKDPVAKLLEEIVVQRMKPPLLVVRGKLGLTSYDPDGVSIVKETLGNVKNTDPEHIEIRYLGGGSYDVLVTALDYKVAEKLLKSALDVAEKAMEEKEGIFTFVRAQK